MLGCLNPVSSGKDEFVQLRAFVFKLCPSLTQEEVCDGRHDEAADSGPTNGDPNEGLNTSFHGLTFPQIRSS